MSIIRAILNNGFFIIVLIVASVLYIAYSDNIKRDHGLLPDNAHKKTPMAASHDTTKKAEPTTVETNSDSTSDLVESVEQNKQADEPLNVAAAHTDTSPEVAVPTSEPMSDNNQEPEKADLTVNTAVASKAESKSVEEEPAGAKVTLEKPVESHDNPSTVAQKQTSSVLTSELDKILDDSSQQQPRFESEAAALSAARQSMMQRDFETAARIYFDVATKAPSANNTGELARALYLAGKKDWAARAWLESAKQLVAEKRLPEAGMLASRLMPFAPQVSNEIRMNLQKIHQQRMQLAQKNMSSMPNMPSMKQMPQQQMMPMQPMPMQPMPNMPPMKQMPQQQMMPMQPMPNMPPMKQMPQQKMMPMQPMPNMPPMKQMPQQQMMPMQPLPPMPAYPVQEQTQAPSYLAPQNHYASYRPYSNIRNVSYKQ